MKLFQTICGVLLVLSVLSGFWALKADVEPVHVVLIEDPVFPPLNEYAKAQLNELENQADNFSFSSIVVEFSGEKFKTRISEFAQLEGVIFLGCFSESCKLEVISILDRNSAPFLYAGRSSGLISRNYLWNLGSIFNQSIQPILRLMDKYSFDDPIIIGDESVESHLAMKIIRDLFTARSWEWKEVVNVNADNVLLNVNNIKNNKKQKILINTSCNNNGWGLLVALSKTPHYIFHACSYRFSEISSDRVLYSSSVDINRLDFSESNFFIDIAVGFIREVLEGEFSNLDKITTFEVGNGNRVMVMDVKSQHVWHSFNVYFRRNNKSELFHEGYEYIKPVVFPIFRQPTEWGLNLELYWRNHNGEWRS